MSNLAVCTYWSNAVQDYFHLYPPELRWDGPLSFHYWVPYSFSGLYSGFWIKWRYLSPEDWESLIEHWDLYAYKPQ